MFYELFIAWRYLKNRRKTGIFSGITHIAVAGVVIGVAALVIALSVMNGYETEVRSNFIDVFAHARVRAYLNRGVENHPSLVDTLEKIPDIKSVTPYISDKALLKAELDQTSIFVRGVDPETVTGVTNIARNIVKGELSFETQSRWPGIILGSHLAERMDSKLGDDILLVSLANSSSFYDMPQKLKFRITGILKTGFYDVDNNYAYIHIKDAQTLFGMRNKISGLELQCEDYRSASGVVDQINLKLTTMNLSYVAESWKEMNSNLFAWVQIQKWAFFIVLSLIILVAAFNITSTQIMVTMEKTRDIGILKAMGARNNDIERIFTLAGLIIGVVGAVFGSMLGYLLCLAQLKWRILSLPSDVYIVDWLPVLIKASDFIIISITALLIAYIASVYPARRAARQDPVRSIREE